MCALPPGTEFVDAFAIDVNGIARGKRIPAAAWAREAAGGIAFSASALVVDARGVAQGPLGVGTSDGDPDALGMPVPGAIVPVPWSQGALAQCLLSMQARNGASLWFDPRAILQAVVDRCRADGLHPVVACELEFYLVAPAADGRVEPPADRAGWRPGSAGHLSLQTLEEHGGLLHAIHEALARQGIAGGVLVSEYGPGQFELNLLHGPDPLRAADQAVLLRRAAIGVAASRGARATFMAKPYAQHAGSGLHVHVSLSNSGGENLFGAVGGQTLLEHAIGGMQSLHGQSMAVFAPSFSAYRRYQAGAFVANASSWGEDNRSVAFRIPQGQASARRIEHRVASADASPHLVMAAILAAIHYGITQKIVPSAASVGNGGGPPDAHLPRDIFAALVAFEQGQILAGYLPARFPAMFAALKRAETRDLFEDVQPIEHAFYL